MFNKLIGILLPIIAIVIIISALIVALTFGIALMFGWWNIIGIIMILFAVILGILMPKVPVWIPILVIGVILVAVEYIDIV